MALSRKVLAHIRTWEPQDLTSSGWDFWLYADGHIAAEYTSRWQGSTTGERYVTAPRCVDVDAIDPSDPDSDAEALLTAETSLADPRGDYGVPASGWRQTRVGHTIR